MKKVVLSMVIVAVATVAAINVNITSREVNSASITLESLNASGFDFGEWWGSNVHRCEEDVCSVQAVFWTWYGKYEKCKDGSDVAHCWDCAKCDA